MIQAANLEKQFGAFRALKGIDLHVRENDVYGFIGHNGAGKSTTIHILAGLSRPSAGGCVIDGRSVSNDGCNSGIGYLPEEPQFYNWMKAGEFLSYLASGLPGRLRRMRVSELLVQVGLEKAAQRKIGGFSRGMKQRLGIAAALVHDPKILLLDEPSSALDPKGRSEVQNIICALRDEGKTILLSTHILSDVERVCTRVGMIADGEMLIEAPLQELMNDYMQPVYDIEFFKAPPESDIQLLRAPNWVESVKVDENKASVHFASGCEQNHRAFALAGTLASPVKSVALRQSSLEDVFLKIMEKGGVEQ